MDADEVFAMAQAHCSAHTGADISTLRGKPFVPENAHQLHPDFRDPKYVHAELLWLVRVAEAGKRWNADIKRI
jgi:hypothetical protein